MLTLYDRGETNPRILDHWGAQPSWAISDKGLFRATLPARVARAFGFAGGSAAGSTWLRYAYPGLPDWGGVVVSPEWSGEGDYVLSAESYHVLMRKRVVPRLAKFTAAPAGAIAKRAFSSVQGDDYCFIKDFAADEDGDPVAIDPRGGDLMDDVLRQLATASGEEWTVDADRTASWRVRLGTDKTGTVLISWPHEIIDYLYATDLWTVVNDLEGVAADQRHERSAYERIDHWDSIKQIGRYQAVKRYEHAVSKSTIRPLLRRDIRRTAWPAETMDLTTVNTGKAWSLYHVGDRIQVCLPMANAIRDVRITARAVDVDAGTERIACEVENEADGW
jgi:hypothetical protein